MTIVQYYADDDRAADVEAELFNFVPFGCSQEGGGSDGDGLFSVYDIGPVHVPIEGGAQLFPWNGGSRPIPDDGNTYHVGLLEWKTGVNNANGGLVSFGEAGSGMHFFDVDTSSFTPDDIGDVEVGFDLTNGAAQVHTSAAGGRDYQVNFTTSDEELPPLGDFNVDGSIDASDYQVLLGNYNMDVDRGSGGDINFSGHVDFKDFVSFREAFIAANAPAGAAVPEPVTGLLLLMALFSSIHFARRSRND